jgi:carboxymethylenebutenolidase
MIEITASDGHKFSAYRAEPTGETKGAVVVLQETFGVNSHIRKMADQFAAEGYVAIAPALFDRVKPGVELGYDEAGITEGLQLKEQLGEDEVPLGDIQATIEAASSIGKVALVGYDWGGYLAYLASNQLKGVACSVGYYADGVQELYLHKRLRPTLIHWPEEDALIPWEAILQFRQNRPDVSGYGYPGVGHGFACDERSGYDAEATQRAQERTLFFLSQFVVGQGPIKMKNAGSYADMSMKDRKKKKKKAGGGGDDMGPPMD